MKMFCGEALYVELVPTAHRVEAEAESSAAVRGAVVADTCTPAIDSDRLMVILKLEAQR